MRRTMFKMTSHIFPFYHYITITIIVTIYMYRCVARLFYGVYTLPDFSQRLQRLKKIAYSLALFNTSG